MTHYQPWIRQESYERILHSYIESDSMAVKSVEEFGFLSFLMEKGLFDQSKTVIVFTLLKYRLKMQHITF
jgi:hypothetical protein